MTSSAISEKLIAARKTCTPLAEFPGTLPDTPEEAYQVQDQCISGWDDELVGWKVAGLKAELHDEFKAKRQSGPVFKKNLQISNGEDHILAPVYAQGFAAIEAEFVILLGDVSSLPTSNLTEQDAIKDFGNNNGVIVGPEIKNWQEIDLSTINVSVKIGGEEVGKANTKPSLDGPLGAVTYLIEHLAQRGHDIKPGTYISSGAITGAHQADVNIASEVTFEGIGTISLELVSNN